MEKLNILVAEDEPIYIDYLKRKIKEVAEVKTIEGVKNAKEAEKFLLMNPVDILITDLYMDSSSTSFGGDGMALIPKARAIHSKIKIIVITGQLDIAVITNLKTQKIDGIVYKKQELAGMDIKNALEYVVAGSVFYSNEIKDHLEKCNRLPQAAEKSRINEVDKRILELLRDGVKEKKLGEHIGLNQSTIDKKIKKLKDIFEVDTIAALVIKAINEGYISGKQDKL